MTSADITFWFALGREPLIAAAEIFAILFPKAISVKKSTHRPSGLPADMVGAAYQPPFLKLRGDWDAANLQQRLGGTVKIGRQLGQNLEEKKLLETMFDELKILSGKITFGISFYPSSGQTAVAGLIQRQAAERWGKRLKSRLRAVGRSVRYVFKNEAMLSSVSVAKNGLDRAGIEFLISVARPGRFSVARTLTVQPFEEFSARDYGRPGRDDQSGMLPPKLALTMVNLAGLPPNAALLDPFCGSGTILSEAVLLGYRDITSADVSAKAVADSRQNLEWLAKKVEQINAGSSGAAPRLIESDIRGLSKKIPAHSIDGIITEPFLGPPVRGRLDLSDLKTHRAELAALYTDAFSEFKKLLKPGGVVVFIFPQFIAWQNLIAGQTIVRVAESVVPKIEAFGFRPEPLLPLTDRKEPYLLYHRPGQTVAREIWKFRLLP